jgi:methionyl-tRNA formyltransferase
MGTPDFAVPTLHKLISAKHELVACFTKEAKPKNRGKKLQDTVIAKIAKEHNIKLFTPKSLVDEEIVAYIKKAQIDFIVVVAYGLILPQKILDLAKYAALNLHPSALPKFRGAAPIERTIMSGEEMSKACVIKMVKKLDAGDILLSQDIDIKDSTSGDFHDKAAIIGADLMLKTINDYQNIKPTSQDDDKSSYAPKITKDEAKIDFTWCGKDIINLIRALSPAYGASFLYKNNRVKIFQAEFIPKKHQEPFGVLNNDGEIFCKDGAVIPKIIQKPGKNKVTIAEFLRGVQV